MRWHPASEIIRPAARMKKETLKRILTKGLKNYCDVPSGLGLKGSGAYRSAGIQERGGERDEERAKKECAIPS